MQNITATPTRNLSKELVVIIHDLGYEPGGSFVPRGVMFEGELIAHVSSLEVSRLVCKSMGMSNVTHWEELNLYRTKSGKFVCQRITRTQSPGKYDVYEGEICEDYNAVTKFFGDGWLAKELYEEADINASIDLV
ncbi:hypothetical protein [Nitrosomonas sp. Is37]|uniref:hypothetical protein n=1 Tax=Nitrosomonas sp. Is37 TaxID=3080535 RepID=UPI00294B3D4A|nr:hypothetical protein [Nitrosomonas sp. Is37]MDV6345191.1 hypothetical protein [Nitrosomonas sp. Is37]